jgi:DNA processing protein
MELAGNQNRDLPRMSMMAFSPMSTFAAMHVSSASKQARCEEARYPDPLRRLASPPGSLWFAGRVPAANERLVAIVGARAASGSGCERTHAMAAELGRQGISIVSGGAFGIDAAAHEGALSAGAPTFAVLGCGTDIVYPDRHAALFTRILQVGGLLSEYPPGTRPRRGQFPVRNRIIAGLSEAVIVAEAATRSGALITAARARELGRLLLAVPGSPGTDALVRRGHAMPVATADDVLAALAGQLVPATCEPGREEALLVAIEDGAATPELLCRRLGLPLPALLARLAEAELDGLVRRNGGDTYEVIARVC